MAQLAAKNRIVDKSLCRGFSLVELMVAMAISLLLLAGVIAIFASSRSSYETTDKLSRIQENGRYALDQLTFDIRSAGFVGCSRTSNHVSTSLNNSANVIWNFLDGPVRGYDYVSSGTWSPALATGIPAPINGSDVLVLRVPVREATALRLQSEMTSNTDNLVLPAVAGAFQVGDIAMAYSCEAQAFFQVTDFTGGVLQHAATGSAPGNAVASLSYRFLTNAEVVPVNTVIYYVRQSTAGARASSLFRQIGNAGPEELVEGIEQMQIEYGVDTNGDGATDTYLLASAVTDWSAVLSVRVALLARSIEAYGTETDSRSYVLLTGANAVTVPAPMDRHYREVFSSTVGIRNKVVVN